MEVVVGLLIPLAAVGGIGGAVALAIGHHNKTKQAWFKAAETLGFAHTPGTMTTPPSMQGSVKTIFVEVAVVAKGSGDNKTKFTSYRIHHPAVGPPMTLLRQHALSRLTRLFAGRKDLVIGDPEFDRRVVIDADDPTTISAYLTPTRRIAVVQLLESWAHASITERMIEVHRSGVARSSTEIVTNVRRLVDMALLMTVPSEVDVALEHQQAGDLSTAAQELHRINTQHQTSGDPNSFAQLLEAEAHVAAGHGAEAQTVLASIDENRVDPEIRHWQAVAEAHPQPAPPKHPLPPAWTEALPDTPDPELPAAVRGELDLDQHAVITALFESNLQGYAVEERFNERYEGHQVTWTGKVDRVRSYATDSDFGRIPGVKVNVIIGQLGDGRLVSNRIHAIVQLPEGSDIARDQTITFTGTFSRVDRYMRNLFVTTAILT